MIIFWDTMAGTGGGTPSYDPADVRFGVSIGGGPAGTCYVPIAADVRAGVDVDDTVGTYDANADVSEILRLTKLIRGLVA